MNDTATSTPTRLQFVLQEVQPALLRLMDGSLTPAETRVLRLIAQGNANREVAGELSLSEETVKGQVRNTLSKLGAKDRAHAAMIGFKRGIIDF